MVPPAPEEPILESIFVPDSTGGRVVAQNTAGDYNVFQARWSHLDPPVRPFELRVRAPLLTDLMIFMNNQQLNAVSDAAKHPEFEASGYYFVAEGVMPGGEYGFYRIRVVPPLALHRTIGTQTEVRIRNTRKNEFSLDYRETTVHFAAVGLDGRPVVGRVEPNTVFDDGWNSKNWRPGGPWQAHAMQSIVARKVTVAGWLDQKPFPNNPEPKTDDTSFVERPDHREDWHYPIWLDPDFIERTYRGHKDAEPLGGAVLRGNPTNFFPFFYPDWNDMPLLASNKAADVGTFLFPLPLHPPDQYFRCELNSWHIAKRGPPPSGWVLDPDLAFADNAWPFRPMLPLRRNNTERELDAGDYVIVSGTLWQDSSHEGLNPDPNQGEAGCWNHFHKGHGGWLEIHPVDMVRREPSPTLRKQPRVVALCAPPNQTRDGTFELTPAASAPPRPGAKLQWTELIDSRFTAPGTVQSKDIKEITTPEGNPALRVSIKVGGPEGGRFKAVYVLWWN